MIILSFLLQFLKTEKNIFYKARREDVRKHYNIPLTDKLWFNGFDYKPIFFINKLRCLESTVIPIQRMIWRKASLERVHIYLRPSFVIKRCPFATSVLEYVWEHCVKPETEPFESIDDPNNLLDSSIPLEHYTNGIFNLLGSQNYMIKWNRLYAKIFYSLPLKVEKMLVEPNRTLSEQAYLLVQFFAKDIRLNIPKYEYLAFANFQIPLK